MLFKNRLCITGLHQLRKFSDGITFFSTDCTLLWNPEQYEDCGCQDAQFRFILEIFNYKIIEIEYFKNNSSCTKDCQ